MFNEKVWMRKSGEATERWLRPIFVCGGLGMSGGLPNFV